MSEKTDKIEREPLLAESVETLVEMVRSLETDLHKALDFPLDGESKTVKFSVKGVDVSVRFCIKKVPRTGILKFSLHSQDSILRSFYVNRLMKLSVDQLKALASQGVREIDVLTFLDSLNSGKSDEEKKLERYHKERSKGKSPRDIFSETLKIMVRSGDMSDEEFASQMEAYDSVR